MIYIYIQLYISTPRLVSSTEKGCRCRNIQNEASAVLPATNQKQIAEIVQYKEVGKRFTKC